MTTISKTTEEFNFSISDSTRKEINKNAHLLDRLFDEEFDIPRHSEIKLQEIHKKISDNQSINLLEISLLISSLQNENNLSAIKHIITDITNKFHDNEVLLSEAITNLFQLLDKENSQNMNKENLIFLVFDIISEKMDSSLANFNNFKKLHIYLMIKEIFSGNGLFTKISTNTKVYLSLLIKLDQKITETKDAIRQSLPASQPPADEKNNDIHNVTPSNKNSTLEFTNPPSRTTDVRSNIIASSNYDPLIDDCDIGVDVLSDLDKFQQPTFGKISNKIKKVDGERTSEITTTFIAAEAEDPFEDIPLNDTNTLASTLSTSPSKSPNHLTDFFLSLRNSPLLTRLTSQTHTASNSAPSSPSLKHV